MHGLAYGDLSTFKCCHLLGQVSSDKLSYEVFKCDKNPGIVCLVYVTKEERYHYEYHIDSLKNQVNSKERFAMETLALLDKPIKIIEYDGNYLKQQMKRIIKIK